MLSHYFAVAATLFAGSFDVGSAKSETRSSYDRSAHQYAQKNRSQFEPCCMEFFVSHLSFQNKVLDLGCGPGLHANELTNRGLNVYGVDFSPAMIKMAHKCAPKAHFYVMDIESLSFSTTFDAVWAENSLHHIPREKLNDVLSKIHNLLNSEGIFYLSMRKGHGEGMMIDFTYENIKKFYALIEEDELRDLLLDNNFEIISMEEKEWVNYHQSTSYFSVLCKKKAP